MINPVTDNEAKWIRKIWTSYWGILLFHDAAQLFSYWFLPYQAGPVEFYVHVLLKPTFVAGSAILSGWMAAKAAKRFSFYALIASGTALAVTIIQLNTDVRIISALFLLPILVAVLFYRRRLMIFTALLQIVAFFLLLARNESYRSYLSAFDVISVPAFIVMCALVAGILMIRGRELQKELYTAMSAKQELMIQYAIMSRQAKMDQLTGLYNQATFREHYAMALDYAAEGTRTSFQLALLDIDDFKSINDTYGHLAGDVVLASVARTAKERLPASGVAARYGGEEFALLLFEPDVGEAVRACEAIRIAVSQLVFEELGGKGATISVGVAAYEPGLDADAMFERADARLYEAKRLGKNRTAHVPEAAGQPGS